MLELGINCSVLSSQRCHIAQVIRISDVSLMLLIYFNFRPRAVINITYTHMYKQVTTSVDGVNVFEGTRETSKIEDQELNAISELPKLTVKRYKRPLRAAGK